MNGVFKISEAASLAMHTMVYLASHPNGPVTAKEIAAVFPISEAHLAKVLQRLVKSGLVRSTRGPRGGFELALPAEKMTLLEIFETIEGPINGGGCLLGEGGCFGASCILGDLVGMVNREVRDFLNHNTLAKVGQVFNGGNHEQAASHN